MELPPFNHHHRRHNRYVPPPPPNFIPHHHLPPPSYPPLPAPPYNPTRPHLFDPPSLSPNPPIFENLHRVPLRFIPPEHHLTKSTLHHEPPNHYPPPYAPIDSYQHDVDINSRFGHEFTHDFRNNHNNTTLNHDLQRSHYVFRDDFIDDFRDTNNNHLWDQKDSHTHHHQHNDGYIPNSYKSPRDFDIGGANSNMASRMEDSLGNFISNVGNYDPFYSSLPNKERRFWNNRDEGRRWVGLENEEFGNSDAVGRQEMHTFESGRLDNWGSREGAFEDDVHSSPNKKTPRKSALLRLQLGKPNGYKNRSREQHFSKGYFDHRNSGRLKGRDKDSYVYPERKMEEERDKSPVELDVSFKSNALVAKAIVPPANLTPANRNIKNVPFSGSPVTKFSKGFVKSESSTHGSDCPSSSGKSLKQPTEKVTASGFLGNVGSTGSSAVQGSPNGLVSEQHGDSFGSVGTPSRGIRKRKRVLTPISHTSSSLLEKRDGEPVNANVSTNSPSEALQPDKNVIHSKDEVTSDGMALVHGVVSLSSPTELIVNKIAESPKPVDSENGCTNIDSSSPCELNSKRKSSTSANFSFSLSPLDSKIDEGTDQADESVNGVLSFSNSDMGPIAFQNRPTLSGIDRVVDVNQQGHHKAVSLLLEIGHVKGSSESMVSVEVNDNACLSSLEETKIHEGPFDSCAFVNGACNALCSGYEYSRTQQNYTVSDVDCVNTGSQQSSLNQVIVPLVEDRVGGSPVAVPSVGDNGLLVSSTAEESRVDNADSSNHILSTTLNSNSSVTNSQVISSVFNASLVDDKSKQSDLHGATKLLENGHVEGSPEARVLLKDNFNSASGKTYSPKVRRKRKAVTIQLDLSSPRTSDTPVNVVSSGHDEEGTTLSCHVNDPVFVEETPTVSGDGNSVLLGNNVNDRSREASLLVRGGINVGPNEASPKYRKKRKAFTRGLSFPLLSEIHEGPVSAETSILSAEVPSNTEKVTITQSEDKIEVSSSNVVYCAGLPACSMPLTVLFENSIAGGSFKAQLVGEHLKADFLELEQESPYSSGLGVHEEAKASIVMSTTNHQGGLIDAEMVNRGEIFADAHAVREFGLHHTETTQCTLLLDVHNPESDQRLPSTDTECESYLLVKDDLLSVSKNMSLCADDTGVSTTNSSDELVDSVPDTISNIDSAENLPIFSSSHMLSTTLSRNQISNETVHRDDKKLDEKLVAGGSISFSLDTSSENSKINVKSGHAMVRDIPINTNTAAFLPQDTCRKSQNLKPVKGESNLRKNQLSSVVPRGVPGKTSLNFTTSRKAAPSSHIAKPRTWHRTGGVKSNSVSVPPLRPPVKKVANFQSSYIRKGNSLVRKPPPVTSFPHVAHASSSFVCWLKPSGVDCVQRSKESENRVDVTDPPVHLIGELNSPSERPKTPPLSCSAKLLNCTTLYQGDSTSLSLADPPSNGCLAISSDHVELSENIDVLKPSKATPMSSVTPEIQIGLNNNMESHHMLDEGILGKKMIYVKRKSNQLIAASNSGDLLLQSLDKTQTPSSNGYYKRKKNQLIRTSENDLKLGAATCADNLNLKGHMAPKVIPNRSFSRRQSGKGTAKTFKPSKFTSVWTLLDTKSRKNGNSLSHQKVLPHLFPWKRAMYWRSVMHNVASNPNNGSLSTISRKLLLSRKRDTVYTRSPRGFSLRISKVLSVCGSSLKWSKSIERNSKKANEDATLAVVAAEKRKREQNGTPYDIDATKRKNQASRKSVHGIKVHPGERIFRIGSVRYKMDPTRRTLQRISDEEPLCLAVTQSGKRNKSYVPRRLLIGNDEYVRIGNGNKLIRDPKKRTRILANEKVRWSLHTARLRLARKKKYCQFFTRFGKCNKDDGKCPYIHDPSKIAVCTKFLSASCFNPNCKLTHKVIPERMQDCSYFLEGLCSNENCPYRHVNVNPDSSICEGFLKGYCANGNECRKKHTFVCPIFEATGVCPRGSKCKLRHLGSRKKGMKRKPLREQKNARGRYFSSRHIDIAEGRTAVFGKHSEKDDFCQEGKYADYISIDVSDEETEQTQCPTNEQTTMYESDPSDLQVVDVDELTKPIRIMNKYLKAGSSLVIRSPSEITSSYV